LLLRTSSIYSLFDSYLDQYIPSKTLTSRWNIPWINQNIKNMIRKKERLYKAAKYNWNFLESGIKHHKSVKPNKGTKLSIFTTIANWAPRKIFSVFQPYNSKWNTVYLLYLVNFYLGFQIFHVAAKMTTEILNISCKT
jgi:hypothetical protein